MASEIKMPQLSDTMSSGKIIAWNKKVGDQINRGDILAEVETDKANLEIEAFQSGVLLSIEVPAGTAATVGQVIAQIGAAGESAASVASPAASAPAATAANAAPVIESKVATASLAPAPSYSADRVKASPLARKIAEQNSVNLATLQGSGPNGRIIKRDVENLSSTPVSAAAPVAPAPSVAPAAPVATTSGSAVNTAGLKGRLSPLSKMRATIAQRMQQAVLDAPHFFTTIEINMARAKEARETLKLLPEYKGLGINHMVIKAAAYALQHEPAVNAAMRGDQLYQPDDINIGIITAVADGLLIPVIKNADTLSLKDITFEARAAIERARAGRPSSSDLTGGTFSISNMGMFDVENFTAIINPGQGGILAISAMREKPIVEEGKISIGLIMKVTLSVDHRIIDGVTACGFLKYFKKALENPVLLLA